MSPLFGSRAGSLCRGPGPRYTVNSKPGVGFTSEQPWEFDVDGEPGERIILPINDTDLPGTRIDPDAVLQFAIFAVFDDTEPDVADSYASTSSSINVVFDDDSTLLGSGAHDLYGIGVDPAQRYESRCISVDQWTLTSIPLQQFAGRTISEVHLVVDVPPRVNGHTCVNGRDSRRRIRGFLDTLHIRSDAREQPADPIELVRTTRGTHSSDRFSRGNCAPLVGRPHGFVFGLPMTDGGNRGWPYSYHEANDATNTPRLQSFATSHIPSPWMGDRGVFQFFPSLADTPEPDRTSRSLPFSHDDEVDRPDRYGVALAGGASKGGLDVEITTGTWSVWMRTRFPGDVASIVFDQIDDDGSLDLSEAVDSGVITGYVDGPGGLVAVPRTYVYAEIDVPVTGAHMHSDAERPNVLGSITIDTSATLTATLAVAVSQISLEQARQNLVNDTAGITTGFDGVHAVTRSSWDEILGRLDADGASRAELTTIYSCLYRLYLYPTIGHEITHDGSIPRWHYADIWADASATDDSPHQTARPTIGGTLTVTDGFWDSYRASWPLRTLVTPHATGMLLNGFVEHYRRGGWTSRWSAPGPADIMTGTSSDAVFSDAALARVPEFDEIDAYDSCLRNATSPSGNPRVGRKGMSRSIFRGFTDTETFEAMSWTVDAAINDAAVAAFSRHLAGTKPGHPRHDEFVDNAAWFTARAANYANVFDVETGFFRGRQPDGSWRDGPFDPKNWGLDYTETNAWGTRFTAPHDGAGLVALYGGRERFEQVLDDFHALAETGRDEYRGWYPVVIHEMREARDTRMGMLALSNQPAHHIPFMYHYASRPGSLAHAKAQRIIRDAVDRLFLGSDAGQGYPGDEDNGEMSAWYLWAISGLYPLSIGSGCYVIGAPAVRRLRWTLDDDAILDIEAPDASSKNCYVQQVWIDDEPWNEITVPRERLARGAHIRVDVGPEPSAWAQGSVPLSITPDGTPPRPARDLTSPAEAPRRAMGAELAENAFDDDSSNAVHLDAGQFVGWQFDATTVVDHYTLTVENPGRYAWTLEGRDTAGEWHQLDSWATEFRWDRQTRIFRAPGNAVAYRVVASEPIEIAQLELFEIDDRLGTDAD